MKLEKVNIVDYTLNGKVNASDTNKFVKELLKQKRLIAEIYIKGKLLTTSVAKLTIDNRSVIAVINDEFALSKSEDSNYLIIKFKLPESDTLIGTSKTLVRNTIITGCDNAFSFYVEFISAIQNDITHASVRNSMIVPLGTHNLVTVNLDNIEATEDDSYDSEGENEDPSTDKLVVSINHKRELCNYVQPSENNPDVLVWYYKDDDEGNANLAYINSTITMYDDSGNEIPYDGTKSITFSPDTVFMFSGDGSYILKNFVDLTSAEISDYDTLRQYVIDNQSEFDNASSQLTINTAKTITAAIGADDPETDDMLKTPDEVNVYTASKVINKDSFEFLSEEGYFRLKNKISMNRCFMVSGSIIIG